MERRTHTNGWMDIMLDMDEITNREWDGGTLSQLDRQKDGQTDR